LLMQGNLFIPKNPDVIKIEGLPFGKLNMTIFYFFYQVGPF